MLSVSCHSHDPHLVSSVTEAYKPSPELHFLVFKTSQSILNLPSYLKPNYMLNTTLIMQLSFSHQGP
jgi:hypothetical protein